MSPRRNRPARAHRKAGPGGPDAAQPLNQERVRRGIDTVEAWGQEQWRVRHIPGPAAVKSYRCPGCDHEVRPGVPHVVVWPLERFTGSGEAERRHWHAACWRARDRRRPTRG